MKGYILDLDGVICDTAGFHFKAWCRLAQEYGVTLDHQDHENLKGVDRETSLRYILGKADIHPDHSLLQRDMERKNQWYLDMVAGMTPDDLFPGTLQFLNRAKEHNIRIALGSASKNARLVLQKLNIEHLFDAIVDGSIVENGKPHPETFLKAAHLLQLKPEECIVFEDAPSGIRAAIAAGCTVIGIGKPESLKGARVVIPSLASFVPHH
ncbi:MAG: beta-phosphoglucomutase [Bacteroidetes bacterium]|nr:beta-phosphoglucomutase [Bacteroidota bacterium]